MYGVEHILKEKDSMRTGLVNSFTEALHECKDLSAFNVAAGVEKLFPVRDAVRMTLVISFYVYTERAIFIIESIRNHGWFVSVKNTWGSGTSMNVSFDFRTILFLF